MGRDVKSVDVDEVVDIVVEGSEEKRSGALWCRLMV
jgi:hypothetical protein